VKLKKYDKKEYKSTSNENKVVALVGNKKEP